MCSSDLKVLKAENYRVVLVNSNPATIMTDPGLVDRTYVEPITCEFVEKIIEAEHPDALLPTLGGQTGLNTAVELAESGVLERYGVEMIGCLSAGGGVRSAGCGFTIRGKRVGAGLKALERSLESRGLAPGAPAR